MWEVPRDKDLISISHGFLDVVMALRFTGLIQIADIDKGIRETVRYLGGMDGRKTDYPYLNILEPGGDIFDTTQRYCTDRGIKNLGAVDIDLQCSLKPAWEISRPVLNLLKNYGYRRKVIITFRNGRNDGFSSVESRIRWLKRKLQKRAQLVRYDRYCSTNIENYASRNGGSPMCIVELQVNK